MLLTTGRKERLSASKGSEIEVSSNDDLATGNVWYCAMLEVNLAKSKRKQLYVRHLDPLLKQDYSPPLIKTTFHRLIRPVPPPDPFSDAEFEAGDVIDVAHKGGWWSGSVIQVMENRRYLVYLGSDPDVIEVDRKNLRPHLVWKDEEWFRCEKRELIESDFSAGKTVEVRTEVEHLGDIWAPAIAIKENEDGTLLVKYNSVKAEEDECAKISLPYSKIRPSPPPCASRVYTLMDSVDALVESGWCPSVVNKVQTESRYAVLLGRNKESKEFNHLQLRPSMEWNDGVWQSAKVLNSEESPHPPEETTASTRTRRLTFRAALRAKNVLGTEKKLKATCSSGGVMQQNPPPVSSNKEAVEGGQLFAIKSETPVHEIEAQLPGELGSNMANPVISENTPVTSQKDIAATKEFHPSLVLGIAATQLRKPAVKTQGKTSPRKKLQAMKNQKGSANDSAGEKAPVETKNRESVNKRKRGQPRKFISTEPNQKTGVAGNGSKNATIELADIADDDQPLASWIHGGNSSSGQSASRTPDLPSSVVEKHVDVVETPPARDSTMVLPFAKKSPIWKVIESMEVFKALPQHPHFSPLAESEEEFREGDAIGAMVMFTGLLEKIENIQVDDPVSLIIRIENCFPRLEKHGFDVTEPRSRISKLLSKKESQTWALEELKDVEKEITEKDSKRRKCEEEIENLSRKIIELKKVKVTMDNEIARMQTHAAVLDHKVQTVEHEFRATVAAPWK